MTRLVDIRLHEESGEELRRLAAYAALSGCALAVDFSVYCAILRFSKYAYVAAICGYLFGVLTHYALSSRVVFRERFDKRGFAQETPAVAKFFAAGACGLLANAALVGLLADICGLNPLIAKAVASGVSFVIVFVALRFFVFNSPATPAQAAAA